MKDSYADNTEGLGKIIIVVTDSNVAKHTH